MKSKAGPVPSDDIDGGVQDGRVQKSKSVSPSQKKVVENAEMKGYLNKLQEMVPFMPKNKRLSKVEVISHAIDYIRSLRQTLGLPPCEEDDDDDNDHVDNIEDSYQSMMTMMTDPVSIKLSVVNNETNQSAPSSPSPHQRQPLLDISSPSNTVHASVPNEDSFSMAQSTQQQDVSKSIAAI